jgi:peptidylprolyl isomerase
VRRRPALLSALTAAALVAVALAGCAPQGRGPGNQPAGCTPELPSGDASSIVKASGTGDGLKAKFPTPIVAKSSQATVLKAGHGTAAQKGSQVEFSFSVFDAETGKSIGASTTLLGAGDKVTLSSSDGSTVKVKSALTDALVCAQDGARIAVASTAQKLGIGSLQQYGISDSGSVVTVIDVTSTYLAKADGVNQLPKDGMPNVITAVDGQPGIVLQELTKPTTARSELVKAGGGTVLKKGRNAVVKYTAWSGPTGGGKATVISSLDSWSAGQAAEVPLSSKSGLPSKVVSSLVGQKVGSQVLVVLPPKDGFAAGSAPTGVDSGTTLIFVIDILGAAQ